MLSGNGYLLGLRAYDICVLLLATQSLAITLEAKSFRADHSGPVRNRELLVM